MKDRNELNPGTIFHRQLDIFNPEEFNLPIHVIGVGATGSFDVMALAKIGFNKIHVWDFDVVEANNTAGQIYGLDDINRMKVDTLKDIVERVANIKLITHPCAWNGEALSGIVIMGADSMAVRKRIFEATMMKPMVPLVCDHRIGGQKAQLFAYQPSNVVAIEDFKKTLFNDDQAIDLPCTLRSVIDINWFVASMTVRNIRRFLVSGPDALVYEMHYDAERCTVAKRQPGKPYVVLE